jgi:hypothetical protein
VGAAQPTGVQFHSPSTTNLEIQIPKVDCLQRFSAQGTAVDNVNSSYEPVSNRIQVLIIINDYETKTG